MRKICVFTGTRADYGLLQPLIREISQTTGLELQVLASGMHLSPEFGNTYREIENDGFRIDAKVEILLSSDTPVGIAKSTGLALLNYSETLERLQPDLVVILGDRFEAFAMAASSVICKTPVAHIHGGELSLGVMDEAFRHAISKMSHLHFTSTEEYRQRVIQLGEAPERVFHVGALGIENIRKLQLLDKDALAKAINFPLPANYALITYHPVTLADQSCEEQFRELLAALDSLPDLQLIFTKANADTDGRVINQLIDQYAQRNAARAIAFTSMGQLRYLSAMRHAALVVGNSSSGIIEAPSFGVPTINIGDRQKGRIKAASVIDCQATRKSICKALAAGLSPEGKAGAAKAANPYEKTGTAKNITKIIKEYDLKGIMKKKFYDLPNQSPQ
jgi:GDP/UDP-N,N'-diacetylbacillosamine 2-epimerase (hydrolysing)